VIIDLIVTVTHYDLEVDGKVKRVMNPYFKPVLQESGFKWLTIDNLKNGERCTVYKYKNDMVSKGDNDDSTKSLMRLTTGKIKVSKLELH
jgi:hypothetical protein